jgi:hypothetical protein
VKHQQEPGAAWCLGIDGLFVVGLGPAMRPNVWSSLTRREREQLARVGEGDVVDVLLDNGRIVRTVANCPMVDQGNGRLRQRTFHLRGILGAYAAERVRVPLGWQKKADVIYHDHTGLKGQRVPYTCPTIREVIALVTRAGLDATTEQRIVGRLELLRAYNAQLRHNEGTR